MPGVFRKVWRRRPRRRVPPSAAGEGVLRNLPRRSRDLDLCWRLVAPEPPPPTRPRRPRVFPAALERLPLRPRELEVSWHVAAKEPRQPPRRRRRRVESVRFERLAVRPREVELSWYVAAEAPRGPRRARRRVFAKVPVPPVPSVVVRRPRELNPDRYAIPVAFRRTPWRRLFLNLALPPLDASGTMVMRAGRRMELGAGHRMKHGAGRLARLSVEP